jgi:hypothetical protein
MVSDQRPSAISNAETAPPASKVSATASLILSAVAASVVSRATMLDWGCAGELGRPNGLVLDIAGFP